MGSVLPYFDPFRSARRLSSSLIKLVSEPFFLPHRLQRASVVATHFILSGTRLFKNDPFLLFFPLVRRLINKLGPGGLAEHGDGGLF